MTRIAHLSDIHFGANDEKIVAASEAWLQKRQPDLVIISGDFTQRAREAQFRAASAYLNRLRSAGLKVLAIPGSSVVRACVGLASKRTSFSAAPAKNRAIFSRRSKRSTPVSD